MSQNDLRIDGVILGTCRIKIAQTKLQGFQRAVNFVLWCQRSINWWIGDLIVMGEQVFGDDIWSLFDQSNLWISFDVIQRCYGVASRVPPANRDIELSWTHHAYVAKFDEERQRELLSIAREYRLTTAEFYDQFIREKPGDDRTEETGDEKNRGSDGANGRPRVIPQGLRKALLAQAQLGSGCEPAGRRAQADSEAGGLPEGVEDTGNDGGGRRGQSEPQEVE